MRSAGRAWPLLGAVFAWCVLAAPLAGAAGEFVVASYNLENFVGDDAAQQNAAGRRTAPKTERAIAAVVRIVKEISPDILGVCEMGSPAEFAVFQARLQESGLGYIASEYVQAADPDRHVALLSRYPIVARHSEPDLTFEVNGAPRKMGRGILDVTVQLQPGYDLRLVGVHLKSKLVIMEGEALVRRHEASLVRQHLDAILNADPQARVLLYGDLNDTRNEAPILEIAGPRGSPTRMNEVPARDSVGDRWTEYWKVADLYSRIDYFFASRGVQHDIVPSKSTVYRSDYWNEASDHRAIYISIVPGRRGK